MEGKQIDYLYEYRWYWYEGLTIMKHKVVSQRINYAKTAMCYMLECGYHIYIPLGKTNVVDYKSENWYIVYSTKTPKRFKECVKEYVME